MPEGFSQTSLLTPVDGEDLWTDCHFIPVTSVDWGADYLQFKPERRVKEDSHFVRQSPFKFAVFQGAVRICLGKEMSLHLK